MADSNSSVVDRYRSHIHGDNERHTEWRFGSPPNYDLVNKLFEEGRTKVTTTSLPGEDDATMLTLFLSRTVSVHITWFGDLMKGRRPITLEQKRKLGGGYNSLLQTSLPQGLRGYDPSRETMESSHAAFTAAFPRGFALEVLHVYSGPPGIVYKFRHWGFMEGPFQGHAPTGEMVELYGMAIFQVDADMKIEKVEFFYDRGELLGGLLKCAKMDDTGLLPASSCCPFFKNV
ncbi:hypothetical protein BHM03_00007212 [Ensete ventricosum]|nr:hypothetical protein BHM03_00007212 [Ensete ventricosum]